MKTVYDNWAFWQRLLNMLENEFGNRCELILHDLTKDYAHTVVDIRNGHITGRKIGDCGSNLGLEVLRGEVKDGDRLKGDFLLSLRLHCFCNVAQAKGEGVNLTVGFCVIAPVLLHQAVYSGFERRRPDPGLSEAGDR